MIIGNKLDMEDERVVSRSEAIDYAKSVGAVYGEVSAKSGRNIELAFFTMVNMIEPPPTEPGAGEEKEIPEVMCNIM